MIIWIDDTTTLPQAIEQLQQGEIVVEIGG
jgi:hypothetical protein